MSWLLGPQKIYLELVASMLRTEIARLNHVLVTLEDKNDYHDSFIQESIKTTESGIRRIRKFIDAN